MSELALGQIKGLSVNSNKVTVPSGHTLYAPGHVIQTLSTTKVDAWTTTTQTTWLDITGFSVSITPKFATSKILVMVNLMANTSTQVIGQFRMVRDSTPIGGGDNSGTSRQSGFYGVLNESTYSQYNAYNGAATFLDSPNTTSAITYKVQGFLGGPATLYVNRSSNWGNAADYSAYSSTITVQEIAA